MSRHRRKRPYGEFLHTVMLPSLLIWLGCVLVVFGIIAAV